MNLRTKKRCTYGIIGLYNLGTGIGYAIIFPTIWNYVHLKYGGGAPMLGLIIAAYSISAFFANPLIGWWNDKSQNTRVIVLCTVIAEVIGNVMYFLGISVWFLVASRLVAGMGSGGAAALLADVTRTTSAEDRTPVLSMVVACRQFGLVIGPAFNLFLSRLDFSIGSFPVNKYSSPGLFMAAFWILVEVAALFLYSNLTQLQEEEHLEQLFNGYGRENSIFPDTAGCDLESSSGGNVFVSSYPYCTPRRQSNIPSSVRQCTSVPDLQQDEDAREEFRGECENVAIRRPTYINNPTIYVVSEGDRHQSVTDNMIESAERFIQSATESCRDLSQQNSITSGQASPEQPIESHTHTQQMSDGSLQSNGSLHMRKISLLKQVDFSFFRDEIVVLMGLSFFSCFAQTVLETVLTPITQKYYLFEELENSLVFLFAGIEVILVFIVVRYASRKVSDRYLLLGAIIVLCTAISLPLFFIESAELGDMTTFPYFAITVVLDLIGISVIIVCSSSLLSKIVNQENQALAQGFRRSMLSFGCILGPLWGGAYLHMLTLLFAVPLGVCVLILLLFLGSFKRLS